MRYDFSVRWSIDTKSSFLINGALVFIQVIFFHANLILSLKKESFNHFLYYIYTKERKWLQINKWYVLRNWIFSFLFLLINDAWIMDDLSFSKIYLSFPSFTVMFCSFFILDKSIIKLTNIKIENKRRTSIGHLLQSLS